MVLSRVVMVRYVIELLEMDKRHLPSQLFVQGSDVHNKCHPFASLLVKPARNDNVERLAITRVEPEPNNKRNPSHIESNLSSNFFPSRNSS